jgi:hypothetical protein
MASQVVIVRDLTGRIRIAIDDREHKSAIPDPQAIQSYSKTLHERLGSFSPGVESVVLFASKMFAPDEIFGDFDAMSADPDTGGHRVLERGIIGAEWLRKPFQPSATKRITLFAVKGGVGRSTAAVVLAWRLALQGRRVVVLDLDLESPGISSTLLPLEVMPDFGIVDWFVEQAVGQADEEVLREMSAPSPLGSTAGGQIIVVPAGGRRREGYRYLPKLARAYAELPKNGTTATFADRVHELVCRLEERFQPDITLIDSRAGVHDIAGVTVTRLNALSLLFAMDSDQTWEAYRSLFMEWRLHSERAKQWRENLKIVAGQVPETDTLRYLESFIDKSYDLFADNMYVETAAGEEPEFNFDVADADAPHTPLRIHWSRAFQQFDPVRRSAAVTDEQVRASFGDFVNGVLRLIDAGGAVP